MNPDALLLAVLQDVLGAAVGEVVEVLHGGDLDDLLRGLDLLDVHLGEADVADLALLLHLLEHAELLLARDVGVDAVQLPQVDLIDAEAPQAHLAALPQIVGAPTDRPLTRAGAQKAGLRGELDAVIGMQRLGDELLGDVGAVGLGGVDEVDTELGEPLEHGDGLVVVGRRSPDALAGDAHRAEAEAGDLEVPADLERARGRRSRCHDNDVPTSKASTRPVRRGI